MTNTEFRENDIRREFNRAIELVRDEMNKSLTTLSSDVNNRISQERARVEQQTATVPDPRQVGPVSRFPNRVVVGAFVKRFTNSNREYTYALLSPADGSGWSMTGYNNLTRVPWSEILAEMRRDAYDPKAVFDSLWFSAIDLPGGGS